MKKMESEMNGQKSIMAILFAVIMIACVFGIVPMASANGIDYFVYSELDTGVLGSYGVDGYVGADGVDRIIFYSDSTAYIYTVTIPPGTDPNMHPDNPQAPGPVAPRTFTLEKTFDIGVSPGHESEFYVDAEKNIIYLGASVGIRKYVYDDTLNNYVYDSLVAPPSPTEEGYSTQSLAYDPANNMWYAGSIAWNPEPGITVRDMWKYDGSQGPTGTWELAFQYTTPEGTDPETHHDGMEFINGYLWLADYVGDYIKQYTTEGELVNVFWHGPLAYELEGMGFGALKHFWCGSHGSTVTEFGGGKLEIQHPLWHEINEELDALIEKVNAANMPNIIKRRLVDKLEYAKALKDNAKEECEADNFDAATKKLGVAKNQVESFASMVRITRRISPADKASFLADATEILGKIEKLIEHIETEHSC